jgi:hypothetical protein
MAEASSEGRAVYRAGLHLFVIVGIFAAFFIALGVVIAVKRSDGTFLAVAGGGTAVLFLLLCWLRLEIRPDGFTYRNLSMNRAVAFADVERAYFETLTADVAPQGVATFWVGLRDGKAIKVNLRTFPIRAAALLFTALERHGIPIDVPNTWAAQRMARQIREEQARLGNRPSRVL